MEHVIKGGYVLFGGRDIAPNFNTISFSYSAELQDRTALSDTYRRREPGLRDVQVTCDGFWANTTYSSGSLVGGKVPADIFLDKNLFAEIGATGQVFAVGPEISTGTMCFFGPVMNGEYNIGARIGELQSVRFTAMGGEDRLYRGTVAYSAQVSLTSAALSTAGDGYTLGALAASDTLALAVFILGSTGGSHTVKVTSSTEVSDFSAETTRLTSTAWTTTGAKIYTLEGAITDTAFRVTVVGTTGSGLGGAYVYAAIGKA